MNRQEKNITEKHLLDFYHDLVLPRFIEEKMLKLLRQGRISKWFSGIGQEAVSVGAVKALREEDFILPMHRNLGVFTGRRVPFYPLFCQLLGKSDGFTGGRERSFHFGIPEYNIIGMISHLAAMLPVACGLALSAKMRKENRIALAFCGEGATSEGDFHEAINLAAVWKLPVIFLIENNGYGLSTPVSQQYACRNLFDRAHGYGIEGFRIDGNDILSVYDTVSKARSSVLSHSRPVLIEAMTFRMRGHEEASGTAYVPPGLIQSWTKKDPILRLKKKILDEKVATESEIQTLEKKARDVFQSDIDRALKATVPVFDEEEENRRVLAAPEFRAEIEKPFSGNETVRFIDCLQAALTQAFDQDESLLMMGQDIAEYGGVFKVTDGFLDRYGSERIRNTPIIESGILGAALGLALEGFKPVVEMQFADFISCGFNQIVNNIAKSHYRWSRPLNITIRAPHGAGVGAGPFHSQSPEGWFMQHPGLKVVVPATLEDAFNLMLASLHDPNPVLIFEHKKLYRGLSGTFDGPVSVEPLGRAAVRREGSDASIITYGMGVHWALDLAGKCMEKGISLEVVDLRTLYPIDTDTIKKSVENTSRVLLLQEAGPVLGPMSEIAAIISDQCFDLLDAPVVRCSSLHTPVPTAKTLEEGYLAPARLEAALNRLLEY